MKTFVATLKSTSPLSFSRYYAQELPKKDKESAADFEERTWRNRLHVTDDGFVLIPPFAFKNCLDSAAKYLGKQIPGRGKATFTKHFVSALLVTAPLILPLKKAAKKLVESKRFRQAMNIMLAANEAFETGFLSPAQLLSTVRTYASDGHFDGCCPAPDQ